MMIISDSFISFLKLHVSLFLKYWSEQKTFIYFDFNNFTIFIGKESLTSSLSGLNVSPSTPIFFFLNHTFYLNF